MERLTHDQMAFSITKLHPKLAHGKDFWVAHPVDTGSDQQIGEAEIIEWPEGIKQPDRKTLHKTFNAHADEFNAQRAKAERSAKLKQSDWTQMPDIQEDTRKAWAKYRQELRDLPKQQAFPTHIEWPEAPEA